VSLTIDASVWVALSDPSEREHETCRRFFRQIRTQLSELRTPTFLLVEVAAAAARKSRDTDVGLNLARRVRSLPMQQWYPLDDELTQVAERLGARLFLRGADAVYAAVAAATDSTLVTLDRELATRSSPDIPTISPADWLELAD
jgi:predicted nucleic acid-binding protein